MKVCPVTYSALSEARKATIAATSSGSPSVCTRDFQAAGITVFHVVPTLDMALKAIDAGVDGLVVEGGEGGGFKNQIGRASCRERV